MKKHYINIAGKDYAPLQVGFGECCINCDIKQQDCCFQCHNFEETDSENVALKEVKHNMPPSLWDKIKKLFMPIESDLPF